MNLDETTTRHYRELAEKAWDNTCEKYMKVIKGLRLGEDDHNVNFRGKLIQKKVAEILGIHAQNYNKIEAGKNNGGNNMTTEHLVKLCTIYGCSADHILNLPINFRQKYLAKDPEAEYRNSKDKIESLEEQNKVLRDALESEKRSVRLLEKALADCEEGD